MPKPAILSTVERRTGVERAEAGKSPHWWTAPTPNSRPPLKLSAARHSTAATGSKSAGARQAHTGVTASRSNANEQIGRGQGVPATAPTMKAGTKPQAANCPRSPCCLAVCDPNIPDRPARWGPGSNLGKPSPPTRSPQISVSPPQTKKSWGTAQARQYVVVRRETEGNERRSRKTTPLRLKPRGRRLHTNQQTGRRENGLTRSEIPRPARLRTRGWEMPPRSRTCLLRAYKEGNRSTKGRSQWRGSAKAARQPDHKGDGVEQTVPSLGVPDTVPPLGEQPPVIR